MGIKGAGASGKSYENWGIHLDEPKYGAVAIFNTRHVGFYFWEDIKKGYVKIGNWSDRVIISTIKSTEIKEYRYPIINFK